MGKRNVVPKLPNPAPSKVGNESPLDAALGPIVTADEYRRAVIALVDGVKYVSDDNKKMLDLSAASRRLLLARYDPPLPLWWTFIALEKSLWLDRKSKDPLGFGTAILDFARRALHSLISLSSVNASGRTTLAAIAPVVGLVYDVASLLSTTAGPLDENQSSLGTVEGSGKQVRELARNLKEFIKELLGFRILCLCQDSKTCERSFSLPSAPNVPLENFPDFLYPQLPLASKGMAKSLSRDLINAAVLAEIVSGEVVLLQLIVETIDRRIVLKKRDTNFSVGQDEYFQRLKDLAVQSVWATNSPSPSEMLLDALLEKRLPVLDLLDAKEETFVRGVLLETVLADPPIFSSYADAGEASTSFKSGLDHSSVVFMKKLSVARRAVAFFRSREELSRLATLEMQMTTWHVPPQLLKWLKSQKKQRLPVVAMQDQQALAKWLVKTAEKSVFTAILDKCVASWSSGLTSVGTAKHIEVLEVESGDAHPDRDGEDLFFVDTAGETKAAIDTEAAADLDFAVASKTMKGESEKMKKKKKKSSKVLFHRHQHSSTGTKRSRMEIDDVDASSCSGSDSEDSEETRSKSAKKLKKSKRKAIDVYSTGEEDEDDDKDGALALAHPAPVEGSPPEKYGSEGTQQHAEPQTLHRTKTPEDHGVKEKQSFGEVMTGGAAEEEVPKVQQQVVAGALLDNEEVGAQEIPLVSSKGTLPLGTPSRSRKGKTVQRFEVTDGVGTVELPSQPEVSVNASVAVSEVDIQNTSNISLVEPVSVSAGKSGEKNKKKPKDPEDPDIEAGGAGTQELSSQLLEETINTSVSATAVDTQNSLTISSAEPVLLSPGKSAKKNTKTKHPVGTVELPSQPEVSVNASVAVAEVDIQNTSNISLVEPVSVSAGKSGKKNKKKPKDPEDPDIEAGGAGTQEFSSQLLGETINTSVSATAVDTQNSLTISPAESVLLSPGKSAKKNTKAKDPVGTVELPSQPEVSVNASVAVAEVDIQNTSNISLVEPVPVSAGKSGKKNKKKPKDPEEPDIEAGGAGTQEFSSQLLEETINTSVSATAVDTQNSLTISPAEPVLLSPGKSAKKKKKTKDPEGPYIGAVSAGTEEVPSQPDKEMDNSSVSVTKLDIQKTSKLVSGYPQADSEGKGAAYENVVVITTSEVVDTRVEVQGVDVKDLANEVTTTTGEDVETRRSSLQTSLTLQNENGEEIGDVAARVQITTLRNVQEETLVAKASKKKRRKENSGHGEEVDQVQFFDAIKQELFTASAKLSSADLIDALQVEKSLQNDPQEGSRNTTSPNKRARSGDDGDSIGDVQGTTTRELAATVSVANSDAMKSEIESTQDGKSSQGDGVLAEILGNGQAEDVNRVSHDESEPNSTKPGSTQVNQPVDSVVLGAQDGSQDTDRLVVHPTKSPIKNVIEQTELPTQGTPASGTSSGSKLKKNRDVTSTPTSRKKRSKDQKVTAVPAVAEDRIQPKEEVVVVSSETPEILQDEKDQDERSVRTPNSSKVSETELVTSVKPSSRKRKVKPEISASVESETTDENQYQRRTRSGRALGTPPPTPTRKVYTRKKLVLEPLEEEK